MNDPLPDNHRAVVDEINALRRDLRTCVNRALWVFGGSVVLICFVFGPKLKISSSMKELLPVGGALLALAAFLYVFGISLQGLLNARLRRRHERESFAILSGRSRAPRRQS